MGSTTLKPLQKPGATARPAAALAESLLREGRFHEAVQAYGRAAGYIANDARALSNYGGLLKDFARFDEAESVLTRAVSLDPRCWAAWSNLGCVMLEQQRYDDAVATFSNALKINPSHVPALSGLGITLRRRGMPIEAQTFYDLAISIEPQNADIRYYRSMALLAAGDYARGFAEYEWRLHTRAIAPTVLGAPHWKGEPFERRTLLVQGEGGLGDILQFARYLPMLKTRGEQVVLCVPPPLVTLLSRLPGIDKVFPVGDTPPAFDLTCPIMSLPYAFQTTLDSIPRPAATFRLIPRS